MKIKLGKSIRLDNIPHCPVCNHKLDGATVLDNTEATPEPGDISVCWNCASFLTYTDDMNLRLLTEMEVYGLDAHAKAIMIEVRKRIKRKRADDAKN